MSSNLSMTNVTWQDMLTMTDEVIAALAAGDREIVREYLEKLAAKKTNDRRTWGRMSMLALDVNRDFDGVDNNRLREILIALRAIITVAIEEKK